MNSASARMVVPFRMSGRELALVERAVDVVSKEEGAPYWGGAPTLSAFVRAAALRLAVEVTGDVDAGRSFHGGLELEQRITSAIAKGKSSPAPKTKEAKEIHYARKSEPHRPMCTAKNARVTGNGKIVTCKKCLIYVPLEERNLTHEALGGAAPSSPAKRNTPPPASTKSSKPRTWNEAAAAAKAKSKPSVKKSRR